MANVEWAMGGFMRARHSRLWLGALLWAAGAAMAEVLASVATGFLSSTQSGLPGWFQPLRDHPIWWTGGAVVVFAGVAFGYTRWQQRLESADDGTPPYPQSLVVGPQVKVDQGGKAAVMGVVQAGAGGQIHIGDIIHPPAAVVGHGSVVWPATSGVVPPLADYFQQRQQQNELDEAGSGTTVLVQVLAGMGGVGKTQLATQLAHRLWQARAIDLRVWVTASTRTGIIAGYARAAARIGIVDDDPEMAAVRWLERLAELDRSWLVVLDDLTDPADLKALWPPMSPRGRVVVTTRRRDAALAGHGRMIVEVGMFSTEEACAFVAAKLGPSSGLADDVPGVVSDLGRLPIALAQACAFMVDQGLPCTAYRARFADQAATLNHLVPSPGSLPDDHQSTVDVTLTLAITDWDQPAGRLLILLSLLDPDGVPLDVLTTPDAIVWLGGDASAPTAMAIEQMRQTIRTLHRYSLASHDATSTSRTVRVHALTQRATRDRTPPDRLDVASRTAANAIQAAWPDVERDPALGQALRANTTALADNRTDALWTSDSAHGVLFRAGDSLGEAGLVSAAKTYFDQLAVDATTRLGADSTTALKARSRLAFWTGRAGDALGSAAEFKALLTDYVHTLGQAHPETLEIRSGIAYWHGQSGDRAGAAKEFEQLQPLYEGVFGPDHPKTLTNRYHIARWHGHAGNAALAERLSRELLDDRIRILGRDDPHHPDILQSRHDTARWMATAGNPHGALVAFAELLPDRIRVLGPTHPDTLITRSNIANWLRVTGEIAAAIAASQELLADRERVLGRHHPDTLTSRYDLAGCVGAAGEPCTAAQMLGELLPDRERVSGPEHPHTIATRIQLARWIAACAES